MPIAIRAARHEDAEELGRLGAALAAFHHELDPQRFFVVKRMEEGYAAWLAKEISSRKAVVLAAIDRARGRERLVGYAYGRLEGRDWNMLRDPAGVAVDLFVTPAARRRGAGRQLVEALVRELAARGAPRVILYAAAANVSAVELFESMGFRRTMIEMTMEVA